MRVLFPDFPTRFSSFSLFCAVPIYPRLAEIIDTRVFSRSFYDRQAETFAALNFNDYAK